MITREYGKTPQTTVHFNLGHEQHNFGDITSVLNSHPTIPGEVMGSAPTMQEELLQLQVCFLHFLGIARKAAVCTGRSSIRHFSYTSVGLHSKSALAHCALALLLYCHSICFKRELSQIFPLCVDPQVVQAIRKCSMIRKLVYVSCNPEGALNNFVE